MLDIPEIEEHPLKRALQERGISQARVAKALGVSLSRLNHYLLGYRTPPEGVQRQLDALERQIKASEVGTNAGRQNT